MGRIIEVKLTHTSEKYKRMNLNVLSIHLKEAKKKRARLPDPSGPLNADLSISRAWYDMVLLEDRILNMERIYVEKNLQLFSVLGD